MTELLDNIDGFLYAVGIGTDFVAVGGFKLIIKLGFAFGIVLGVVDSK